MPRLNTPGNNQDEIQEDIPARRRRCGTDKPKGDDKPPPPRPPPKPQEPPPLPGVS